MVTIYLEETSAEKLEWNTVFFFFNLTFAPYIFVHGIIKSTLHKLRKDI